LSEALHAKKQGRVFSITFIGVNGVGKSTSLAKMAYYLRTKGNLKVMLAGCDNFRSGAIE
jgi:signal recognition particle receptor subunit alpha